MNCRRLLVVALLVYVILDLSLPVVPGAFEFDPDHTVESAKQWRCRAYDGVVGDPGRAMVPPAVRPLAPVASMRIVPLPLPTILLAPDPPRTLLARAPLGAEDPH